MEQPVYKAPFLGDSKVLVHGKVSAVYDTTPDGNLYPVAFTQVSGDTVSLENPPHGNLYVKYK